MYIYIRMIGLGHHQIITAIGSYIQLSTHKQEQVDTYIEKYLFWKYCKQFQLFSTLFIHTTNSKFNIYCTYQIFLFQCQEQSIISAFLNIGWKLLQILTKHRQCCQECFYISFSYHKGYYEWNIDNYHSCFLDEWMREQSNHCLLFISHIKNLQAYLMRYTH